MRHANRDSTIQRNILQVLQSGGKYSKRIESGGEISDYILDFFCIFEANKSQKYLCLTLCAIFLFWEAGF